MMGVDAEPLEIVIYSPAHQPVIPAKAGTHDKVIGWLTFNQTRERPIHVRFSIRKRYSASD